MRSTNCNSIATRNIPLTNVTQKEIAFHSTWIPIIFALSKIELIFTFLRQKLRGLKERTA